MVTIANGILSTVFHFRCIALFLRGANRSDGTIKVLPARKMTGTKGHGVILDALATQIMAGT